METPRHELKQMEQELKESVPEPVCSALDKESKSDAINKHMQRKAKETTIVPPTCTGMD